LSRLLRRLALVLLLGGGLAPVQAQPTPQISLLTFQPGAVYWQRYGHNALRVVDGAGERVYNYGLFDFQQKNFALNFARGRMLYRLGVASMDETLAQYAYEGRWVHEQVLDFSTEQARAVARFLARNAQPELADYRYDYFTANCSTKLRDVIDLGTDGLLARQLQASPTNVTYRSEAARMMAPVPPMLWLTDAMLGIGADQPLTLWEQSFLPEVLMTALRAARFADGRPLVRAERSLLRGQLPEAPQQPPVLWPGFAVAGLLVATLFGVVAALAWRSGTRRHRRAFTVLAGTVWLFNGLAGLFLLLGWIATDHAVMATNANLLLLSPLSLLWLAALVATRRGSATARRWIRGGAVINALLATLALALQAMPGAQAHLHWVLLWWPLHGVLAVAMWSGFGAAAHRLETAH